MSVFDRFENAVERGVNGAFSKVFRSQVKPVDIASALRRAMDDNTSTISSARTVVPNEFTVHLSEKDFDALNATDILIDELAAELTTYATEQSYNFVGPIRIEFRALSAQMPGDIRVLTSMKRGNVIPETTPTTGSPTLEIGNKKWVLTEDVTVIGRGSEADIVLQDSGVSRKHLEIRVTPYGVIAVDLGSTNGSYVEGHRITEATLLDGNELTVGRTTIYFYNPQEGDYQ
ncbi:MAG: DUF3662 and FHA domain-containing protein [Actinomycetaceae bacterium]|nr:DUF3662 and FHA domain-containing protein [Actinomycetaceae bacterium]